MTGTAPLRADLAGLTLIDEPARVRQRSRDFYWYSPVLKRQLDAVTADLVVEAGSEHEVVQTLAACFRHEVPVTVRGGGTGNYGQAMPLRGGVVLDLSRMDAVRSIGLGVGRFEAGLRLAGLDRACQEHSAQELRFHPSTLKMGTIGGFIAGGSSGIGSITHGILREPGNILGLRVVTMEAAPRVIELEGDDIQKANHAYGTNGVITEVTMPLAPAYPWIDLIVGFADLAAAVRFADALSHQDAITKKLVSVLGAPIAESYFRPLRGRVPDGSHVVLVMIGEPWLRVFKDFLAGFGGDILLERAADDPRRRALPIYELSWNHTTLHALKVDPTVTYLQVLYPPGDHVEKALAMDRAFGGEVMTHLEFVRFEGRIACFGLPIVRFESEERLDQIIRHFEDHGCPIFNPHAFTLEEGGMKQVDRTHLAFKRETDPRGLLNPGKMLGWEDPGYTVTDRRSYLYKSITPPG
ncbi:MAG: FAD-binding oxidoreductase [Geminicoccaceae bacterium]|nr:FAD-binding oxidoreductase [Geminicoccaceae bacterium]